MWFSFFITWEQRKLGELCEKFADGDWIEAKDQSSSGIRLIQTGNIGLGEYLDKPNNKKWISEDTFNRLHCEEVCTGDILISRLPEPAGRACIVPNLGTKMITAVDCTIVRISTKVSKKFLLQHLSSKKYFNEVNTCMAGGTRQRISRSNLANFNVLLPISFDEQESIGRVLCGLDNLITLHQCKGNLVQNKYGLHSLFQMQYKLADDWEQRKARDLFNSYADKGYPELPVLSATQDAGMVKRDEIGKSVFHDKSNEVGYKRVLPGQFVIHLRSFQGGFAHSNIEGITSPAYTIFGFKPTEKQYDIFWKYIFSSEEFVRRLETVTYGIRDGRSISYDEFLTMGFIVPSYAEQVKIAHGLIITDNLITLHQRGKKHIGEIKNDKRNKTE